jgi:hypothetical protein
MAEKSFRGAFEESKKIVHDAAVRAKDAVEPGLKAVRDAAGKIRDQIGHGHPLHADRSANTVAGEHYVYELHETNRGEGQDGSYVVGRRRGNAFTEIVGSFEVTGATMTARCTEGVSMSEIALVAAAWLEEPAAATS